jgi:glycerol-3-phosphate dehydrogenase
VNRDDALARLGDRFDVLIIGGGATGLGAAVDAAARGYLTALIEAEDFAKATSSRSTKLVHGGVRYLQSGEIALVREALAERERLLNIAPHLVRDLPFILPTYRALEAAYYYAGLKLYDGLARGSRLPRSRLLSAREAVTMVPGLNPKLRSAVMYHDGQFDDARFAVTLARTAVDRGAVVGNYLRAQRLLYARGRVCGAVACDRERGLDVEIHAKAIINATGIFTDETRALDETDCPPLLTLSRGTHVVVSRETLGTSDHAVIVPKTPDGRVIFATPWHEHTIVGTTDIVSSQGELDPQPTRAEVDYLLATVNPHLVRALVPSDISAAFAGLRPLVDRKATSTPKQSREHHIVVSRSGLITVTGGKWTTYRKMAQDVVDIARQQAGLALSPSPTATLALRGAHSDRPFTDPLRVYGTDADAVLALCEEQPMLRNRLHPRLPYILAQVIYAVRHEMARTLDDVLARRTRALFLDVDAALTCAGAVARMMAQELNRDEAWQRDQISSFRDIAARTTPL